MKYPKNIREEELKIKVGEDYFPDYDCTKRIGDVDFCVGLRQTQKELFEYESLLWAEAKLGASDIYNSIVQLILTIGKARTFDDYLPPPLLGAFDSEKIAFIPYSEVSDIFYINDFNWRVTPSNHETKEFKLIHGKVKAIIDAKSTLYTFGKDDKELKRFIKDNFIVGKLGLTKTRIDKNNFMIIYNKWLAAVKPTIAVNWDAAKKTGIIDGDFYLADLLSQDNVSIKEKLFVLLERDHYILDRKINDAGFFTSSRTDFLDKQIAHTKFWNKYERPPKSEYWDYIVDRRDLLVPQDVREIKGAYYTPKQWVELSQKYLTDLLGEDWQDEYYVWDCAAGTGNLLTGLTNKYNIYASTLDTQDVEVMHDRIKNGANLLDEHVFQFDFLNDEFIKLPQSLQNIINDPVKRRKLILYINPPYAEADNRKGEGRTGVAVTRIHQKYSQQMGYTKREMYIQFFTRIYFEIPEALVAHFSKLKQLQAPMYVEFRDFFQAKLEKLFLTPADTFDNVKGQFPIGFFVWNTAEKERFKHFKADVYDGNEKFIGTKNIWAYDNVDFINDWVKTFRNTNAESIATIIGVGSDFQNQRLVRFGEPFMKVPASNHNWQVTKENLIETSIYYCVRHIIDANWLNDRDQFLFPKAKWKEDAEFQNDCFTWTLFSNNVSSSFGTNHWIPFTETDVAARTKFDSNFMTHFIKGKLKPEKKKQVALFDETESGIYNYKPLEFSEEATAVFDAGRKLWKYYHKQKKGDVNASLYDIRDYFQGRNEKGKMNNSSEDETYSELIADLRLHLRTLADKIRPKVYKYGFLKK